MLSLSKLRHIELETKPLDNYFHFVVSQKKKRIKKKLLILSLAAPNKLMFTLYFLFKEFRKSHQVFKITLQQ